MKSTPAEDALSFLASSRRFGMKLGLDAMRTLVSGLGNPHLNLRFIHIAGTNGKGSTAAFCASILQEQGFKTALFTSPHLIDITERFQINRQPISTDDFTTALLKVRTAANDLDLSPSFFEILTAVALLYFKDQQVDWVVWETGMGGRLDATSVVTPEVCVITSIGWDHQAYLGNTLEQIAGEKAGIIKPGVPVITSATSPALEVIQYRAKECDAPLTIIPQELPGYFKNGKWIAHINHLDRPLGLIGTHQSVNAACAIAVATQLTHKNFSISSNAIANGLAKTYWPGRFQQLQHSPPFIIDGAHNLNGAEVLLQAWRDLYGDTQYHLVFGSLADKSYAEVASILKTQACSVALVEPRNERALKTTQAADLFTGIPIQHQAKLESYWDDLIQRSTTTPVLIAGSLFLVGEALSLWQGENPQQSWNLNERLG